jgi:DNA primase
MIKEAIPVRQFVLRYVELSPSGKGLCPFHDDQMPSLHVNDDRNFWWCFACEKGGSVIDFYMALQDCDFPTAVAELGEMLFERPLDEVPPDEG